MVGVFTFGRTVQNLDEFVSRCAMPVDVVSSLVNQVRFWSPKIPRSRCFAAHKNGFSQREDTLGYEVGSRAYIHDRFRGVSRERENISWLCATA